MTDRPPVKGDVGVGVGRDVNEGEPPGDCDVPAAVGDAPAEDAVRDVERHAAVLGVDDVVAGVV